MRELDASDWTRDTNVAGLVHDETRLTVRGLNNERLKWLMDACRDSIRELDLSGNAGIDSWEPMHGAMPNLQWIDLDGTAISSWTGIEGLHAPSLQELYLSRTAISSWTGIEGLRAPDLQRLYLVGTAISSWTGIEGFRAPNLRVLDLDGTAISSWTDIEGLRAPNLQWLVLDGTAISSPDGFTSLNAPRLEHVHLVGAPLRSIDGMTRPGLRIWWDGPSLTVECAFIQAADPHPDPCCICLDAPGTHRYRTCTCTARVCAGCCEGLLEARYETCTVCRANALR